MEEILNILNKAEVFIKKHFGDKLDPEEILSKFKDEKTINTNLEGLKTSSLEQFKNLASISALCATLLVIATFNDKIIGYNVYVQIILTVLLVVIMISTLGYFFNFNIYKNSSIKEIKKIATKNNNNELLEKIDKIKKDNRRKYWYLAFIPFISVFLINLVIVALIILIWVK